jgi:choline-sulfatase
MGPEPPAGRPLRSARGRWRYRFVVGLIWMAVLAAAAAGWRYARTSGPVYGPIIVISIDSLRADRLPAYGRASVRTPAIDALAADGVTFERAYSHSPLTLPSHVSMLSGLLPFQSGVRDEIGFEVAEDVPLLPRLLRRRGFKTGGIVSSVLLRKETGLGAAFGFFDDELGAVNGARPDLPTGGEGTAEARDGAEALKVAERWIESIGTERFFLFLHLPGPTEKATYDARVADADELVGQLVAFLKKRGLYTGGVIVLTSGHGLGLGDHGEDRHGLFLYEPVVRVPLIVKPPRRDGGGRHSAALVQLIDIAPTVLDLVGAPRPSKLSGRSLRNVLDSPTAIIPPRQVYAETFAPRLRFGWGELQSLTDDRHRYIRAPRPELYDVLQDPRERNDLSESEAATAEQLRAALEALTANAPAPQPSPVPDLERERLAALGYLAIDTAAPAVPVDAKDRNGVYDKYWRASRLAGEGKVPEAIVAYRDVVKDDPSLAAGWDRLASLLLDAGRLKEAAGALTSLLRLYPEEGRVAAAETRLRPLTATSPVAADRAILAATVWTALGEKSRAAEIRSATRKAVGDAAVRKAEAALK